MNTRNDVTELCVCTSPAVEATLLEVFVIGTKTSIGLRKTPVQVSAGGMNYVRNAEDYQHYICVLT